MTRVIIIITNHLSSQHVLQQELQYDRMLKELKGLKNVKEVRASNLFSYNCDRKEVLERFAKILSYCEFYQDFNLFYSIWLESLSYLFRVNISLLNI